MDYLGRRSAVPLFCFLVVFVSLSLASASDNYPQYKLYPSLDEIDYSKDIVLLVHGWSNDAGSSENYWNPDLNSGFEDVLTRGGFEIVKIQYWPANLSARKTGGIVASAISQITNHPDNNHKKINVVSHSFGGLATRAYVEGLAVNSLGEELEYGEEIDKLVLIGSPMHGSFFANLIGSNSQINALEKGSLCADLVRSRKLTGFSEATHDLEIGSNFIWDLNNDFNYGVDYLVIAGRRIAERTVISLDNSEFCMSNGWETNDGVVSVISTSLINRDVPFVVLDKFHTIFCSIKEDDVAGEISSLFFKDKLDKDSVNQFLNTNNNLLSCKPWNSRRTGEIYYDPSEPNPDLWKWSSLIVKLNNSEIDVNEIVFKKEGYDNIYNLEKNKISKNWYYLDIDYVKNQKLDFSTLLPNGEYTSKINDIEFDEDINLQPGIVNLVEISLNDDGDDKDDSIYPNAPEMCNLIDNNCDGRKDDAPIDLDDGIPDTRDMCLGGKRFHYVTSGSWADSNKISDSIVFKNGEYLIGDQIEIIGSDLTINCQNSKFIDNGIDVGDGIFLVYGENVTIENCIIKNSWGGIEVLAPGSILRNIQIINTRYAFRVGSASAPSVVENLDIINTSQKAIGIHSNNPDLIINNVYFGTINETEINNLLDDLSNRLTLNISSGPVFAENILCNTEADTNCNAEISIFELIYYAGAWKNDGGDISFSQLMEVATEWVNG